jgi:hypothetical protein
MKQKFSRIVSSILLLNVCALAAESVTPTVVFRSQSRDKVRQMVGVVGGTDRTNHTHRYGMESWNGLGSIMIEYTQSFRPHRIAHCLFGDDLTTGTTSCSPCTPCPTTCNPCDPCSSPSCPSSCGKSILIQGSRVPNRNSRAWLADYFYLPSDFRGSISFKPRIRNIIVDFDFYLGLDQWINGLYFRLYGPVVNTRWDLNFCECIENAGTNSHPQGYFAPSCISNAVLLKSFESYAAGNTITSCDGITFQPLKFAKIERCERTKTGFADLRLEFGWDFLLDPDYHLGANIQMAAPTGNKRRAEFAFAPVVGNGHHWELGGGFTGHYTFWRSEDEEKAWGFHFDANFTHLFPAKEQRTFDLIGKPNSRYMLASKFTNNVTSFLAGSDQPGEALVGNAAFQFANEYAPVANLTTLDVKTSIAIQADIVALFNLTVRGFSWDIGYNFWARTCEKIHCLPCSPCTTSLCDQSQANMWGLKGDARMFGFVAVESDGLNPDIAIPLSSTESKATIHSGTNIPGGLDTVSNDPYERNFSVDNARFAVAGNTGGAPLNFAPFLPAPDSPANAVKTSVPSVLLTCNDIDFCELSRGISHKIFTHFGYTWDRANWRPFFGFGAFGEFGKTEHKSDSSCTPCLTNCPTNCSSSCTSSTPSCLDCALSQWGVWVKGGIAFD